MPRVDGMRHDPVALRFVADFFAGLNQMKLLLISGWHLVVLPRVIQPLVKMHIVWCGTKKRKLRSS